MVFLRLSCHLAAHPAESLFKPIATQSSPRAYRGSERAGVEKTGSTSAADRRTDQRAGRSREIGLRRALGATKGHIRTQFLSEAILLALLGGALGVTLGILATAVYAHTKNWTTVIPTLAWAGGLAAAMAIGAIAGLLPAIRAARLSPTDALRTL
jgi:putative ABC transport system permease protein